MFIVKTSWPAATPTTILRNSQSSVCNQLSLLDLSIVIAKRLERQLENLQDVKRVPPPESFPTVLAQAEQEKYGDLLNFKIGFTPSKGYNIIVYCKMCLCHPPAGSVSHTRIIVYEDGSFDFQVLWQ